MHFSMPALKMALEKVYFLPIITVLLLSGTIAITFWFSRILKHVTHFPSYISDSGANPPESCIFGQFLNMVALSTSITLYVKYRQMREIFSKHHRLNNLQQLNKTALWIGYIACFGMTVVANFQETNMIKTHFGGAFLMFGSGTLYQCLQSFLSLKIRPLCGNIYLIVLKIIMSVIAAITFLIFFVCSFILLRFGGEDITKWASRDGLSEIYDSATGAEWICATSIAIFILTLTYDLLGIVISEPVVIIKAISLLWQQVLNKNLFFFYFVRVSRMLKYLPITLYCLIHATLGVTFLIATSSNHVTYFLPYISDSGTFPPESCIFGQALNIMAALMCGMMYVRYLQVKEIFLKHNFARRNHQLNKTAFIIGLMACLGCSIVANFQETVLLLVHWFGAILVFGAGAVYQCFQTVIYFRIYPLFGCRTKNIVRAVLATISSVSFVSFVTSGIIAGTQFKGEDVTKWKKEDGGFEAHLVSTTSEWTCASCTMIYLLFFVWDFKEIVLSEPEIFVNDNREF